MPLSYFVIVGDAIKEFEKRKMNTLEVKAKIARMILRNEFLAPDRHDALDAGIVFATDLAADRWTPRDVRPLLERWIREASELLEKLKTEDVTRRDG